MQSFSYVIFAPTNWNGLSFSLSSEFADKLSNFPCFKQKKSTIVKEAKWCARPRTQVNCYWIVSEHSRLEQDSGLLLLIVVTIEISLILHSLSTEFHVLICQTYVFTVSNNPYITRALQFSVNKESLSHIGRQATHPNVYLNIFLALSMRRLKANEATEKFSSGS